MIINRSFCAANKNTFKILAIKELIERYISTDKIWIDPFCNDSIFKNQCKFTNDLNPMYESTHHLFADQFLKIFDKNSIDGILFDPPYSYRQIKESYNGIGSEPSSLDTSYNFYARCFCEIDRILKPDGIIITFGWNSNGVCNEKSYRKLEILMIAHGLHHNDTICTVEKKIQDYLF